MSLWRHKPYEEIDSMWIRNNNPILLIPPQCFTKYEDFLKNSVKFQPPLTTDSETTYRHLFDPQKGLAYSFREYFPAPAESEPDRLKMAPPIFVEQTVDETQVCTSMKDVILKQLLYGTTGSEEIDDGFGGKWQGTHSGRYFILKRQSNLYRLPPGLTSVRYRAYFDKYLQFEEQSNPVKAGVSTAFNECLTSMTVDSCMINVVLWVGRDTGAIEEVVFMVDLKDSRPKYYNKIQRDEDEKMKLAAIIKANDTRLSIPLRCFTMYEDNLKKTVKFKPSHGEEFSAENLRKYAFGPEMGIVYEFNVEFDRDPEVLNPDTK